MLGRLPYIQRDGIVAYADGLADQYIEALIQQRMTALLTPICAELTADVIEYSHGYDHQRDPGRGDGPLRRPHYLPIIRPK